MTQKNDLNSQASRCSCTALRKASRRISQLYDAALVPSGLKTTQRAILAQIQRSEPSAVGSLAEALVMDPGALAHTLKPLERDGLVSIDIDRQDRRNRLVKLTPAGRTRLAESDVLWENAQRSFEVAFGRVKSEALRDAMGFLISGEFARGFEKAISSSKPKISSVCSPFYQRKPTSEVPSQRCGSHAVRGLKSLPD